MTPWEKFRCAYSAWFILGMLTLPAVIFGAYALRELIDVLRGKDRDDK